MRAVIGACEEIEVLSAGIEGWRNGVGKSVGYLMSFLFSNRVNKDGSNAALEIFCIRYPLRIR